MYTAELIYEGELRTIATHCYSNTTIFTDAPLDNHGKAQSFSPTDLVATSLATCMMTIMGIEANKRGIVLDGTKMHVTKVMATNPRRISEIKILFEMSNGNLSSEDKQILEHAAHNCPVAKSIHPEIKQEIVFVYPGLKNSGDFA